MTGQSDRARAGERLTQRLWELAGVLPALAWLALFVLVPMAIICVVSLWESDLYGLQPIWTLRHWQRLFESTLYLSLLLKTLRIALVATLLSLLIAYPVALLLSQLGETRRRIAITLLFVPFWVGFVVRTFAWLPILGRNGFINQTLLSLGAIEQPIDWLLYNEGAVYVGLVNGYLLFMVLPIYLSLDAIDRSLREAAADLDAGPFETFRYVLLPLSLPGVASGCIMVFLLSFGAYVTPAMLGGPSGIMLSNLIAQQFTADNNWPFGAALSILMTGLVIAALLLTGRTVGLQRMFLRRS
ncbi:MAG TPA: ABC transporter permease [Steroidobacteraceae bacterium]|nr:ABC transporter permease [Steroidobacteraceae bacterium]